ncbi:unnamed protein product [Owenia fusiformis]|uniref:EGF-like domain-containing protein n=1 Tax=Owenia fusiformis TaxID=6347 RepID=A0A8S4NMQ8_OWEFU|nr:unnamed protein product [Owenia fusiformis]
MRLLLVVLGLLWRSTSGSHFQSAIFWYEPQDKSPVAPGAQIDMLIHMRISWTSSGSTRTRCDKSAIESMRTTGENGNLLCRDNCARVNNAWTDVKFNCTDYDPLNNWSSGIKTSRVTLYEGETYRASYRALAWRTSLAVGGGQSYELSLFLNTSVRTDIGRINTSPITMMFPTVKYLSPCDHTIRIPVADADGDVVRCRLASASKQDYCGGICDGFRDIENGKDAVMDPATCTITFEAIGKRQWYGVQIVVEDFAPSDTNFERPLSQVPLAYLLLSMPYKLTSASPIPCNMAPYWVNPTPPEDTCFQLPIGRKFSLTVAAKTDNTNREVVAISTLRPVIGGMMKKPDQVSVSPLDSMIKTATYEWSPTRLDEGYKWFCVQAIDEQRLQSPYRCYLLNIGEPPELLPNTRIPNDERLRLGVNTWKVQLTRRAQPAYRGDKLIRFIHSASGVQVDFTNTYSIDGDNYATFYSTYDFLEDESYEIRFDEGMFEGLSGKAGCRLQSSSLDQTFWKFTIDEPRCPGTSECSGNGECIADEVCVCNAGYNIVPDCSQPDCSSVNDCNGQGICISPNVCGCSQGFTGEDCTVSLCKDINECSNNGKCKGLNDCECDSGFIGTDCSKECPSCENGKCVLKTGDREATCECDDGFIGKICNERVTTTTTTPKPTTTTQKPTTTTITQKPTTTSKKPTTEQKTTTPTSNTINEKSTRRRVKSTRRPKTTKAPQTTTPRTTTPKTTTPTTTTSTTPTPTTTTSTTPTPTTTTSTTTTPRTTTSTTTTPTTTTSTTTTPRTTTSTTTTPTTTTSTTTTPATTPSPTTVPTKAPQTITATKRTKKRKKGTKKPQITSTTPKPKPTKAVSDKGVCVYGRPLKNGRWRVECNTNKDCPNGYLCNNNVCCPVQMPCKKKLIDRKTGFFKTCNTHNAICPGTKNYVCKIDIYNRWSLCCKTDTCTFKGDTFVLGHFRDPEDNCTPCKCKKRNVVTCHQLPQYCKVCKVGDVYYNKGEIYTDVDGCSICECDSPTNNICDRSECGRGNRVKRQQPIVAKCPENSKTLTVRNKNVVCDPLDKKSCPNGFYCSDGMCCSHQWACAKPIRDDTTGGLMECRKHNTICKGTKTSVCKLDVMGRWSMCCSQPSCVYRDQIFVIGRFFDPLDDCTPCKCKKREVVECRPTPTTCHECPVDGTTYMRGDSFMRKDGCTKCTCISPKLQTCNSTACPNYHTCAVGEPFIVANTRQPCIRNKNCPNGHKCVPDGYCCLHKSLPCENPLTDSDGRYVECLIDGESCEGVPFYKCKVDVKNRWSVCCPKKTCKFHGIIIDGGAFKDPIDNCTRCKCHPKTGKVMCEYRRFCNKCKANGLTYLRGEFFTAEDGCSRCECVSPKIRKCDSSTCEKDRET